MNKYMVHPGLMANIKGFLSQSCSIQEYTLADTYSTGETEEKTWSDVSTSIDCKIARLSKSKNEIRRPDKTLVLHPYAIVLDGVYTVNEKNRIVSDGSYYDILSVDYDSENTFTSLICERIKW